MKQLKTKMLVALAVLLFSQSAEAECKWILWEKAQRAFSGKTGVHFDPIEWRTRMETGSLAECSPVIAKHIALQEDHFRKLGHSILNSGERLSIWSKPTEHGLTSGVFCRVLLLPVRS